MKTLLKQALDALEIGAWYVNTEFGDRVELDQCNAAIAALKAELAKPDQDSGKVIGELERLYENALKREFDLSQALEAAADNNLDKLMAMSDDQVRALAGFEGHHPDDLAALARQTFEIALLKAELAKHSEPHIPAPRGFIAQPSIDGVVRTSTTNCNRHPDAPHVLVPESMVIDSESVRFLDSLSQPDDDGDYSEIRLLFGNGHAGYGLYACIDEYPEEGAEIIYKVTAISQGATHQTHNCSRHPDAPHGFDRNGSHNSGRYMCECENWEPWDAS